MQINIESSESLVGVRQRLLLVPPRAQMKDRHKCQEIKIEHIDSYVYHIVLCERNTCNNFYLKEVMIYHFIWVTWSAPISNFIMHWLRNYNRCMANAADILKRDRCSEIVLRAELDKNKRVS